MNEGFLNVRGIPFCDFSRLRVSHSSLLWISLIFLISGEFLFSASLASDQTSPVEVAIPVDYSAPADGFLSLALCNEHGQLVRSLLYAKPVKAGKGEVTWDGTSDLGIPQPAGSYSTKAIFFTEKPQSEYVMTIGKSGNPPYRTPDGKGDWGGNLGGPAAICANSNSVMMVWSCVEDNQITGIQQMDPDGNILMRYFSFYPWDGRLAGTMDDRNFYLGILHADKRQVEIAEYELGKPRGKILTVLPTKPHNQGNGTRWTGRFTATINGMTLTTNTLYATICADDALFIIDRATGQIRKQITIPSPKDVKVAQDGLIVQSGNKIVRLTLEGEVEHTLVEEGVLTGPSALAVAANGEFYSSGAHGQVARFKANGKLLSKLGKEGGAARTGQYESAAFGYILAMTLGPKEDSLWVQDINTGFPRTSRWSLKGKLQREWFTPKLDLWTHTVNPARPNEVLKTSGAFSDEPGIHAYEVDWNKKTWQPGWFYDNTWAEMFACTNVYLGYTHGGNPLAGGRGGDLTWPIFHYAGHTFVSHGGWNYFINGGGNDDGAIYKYSAEHKPIPVALVGYHHVMKRPDGKYEGSYDQGPNQWMTWADRNGDGRMSPDEITHVKNVPALEGVNRITEGRLDADLNVHFLVSRGKTICMYILPPKEILTNGVPVYDWSMVKAERVLQSPDLQGGDGIKTVRNVEMGIPLEANDGLYALVSPVPGTKLYLPGIDGSGWWASRNWRKKVVKFDKNTGEPVWAVGRRAPAVAEPGQMYHPAALSGIGGDAIFVIDSLGPVWVWHKDGLLIGRLFRDPGHEDSSPDQLLGSEIQSTFIFNDPKTGRIYHLGSGSGVSVHEIKLPDIQHLASTSVTLSSAQAKAAQPWDPDGVTPSARPTCIVGPAPGKAAGFYPVKVDGELDGREGWFGHSAMLILLDGQAVADVHAMYDAKNLYLGYRVWNSVGPANSGSELPYAPFVSGAYVDFCIASDWSLPQRHDVREGDVRVILARVTDGVIGTESVFQQGFWQKHAGGTNAQTIASPAAKIHFDQIAPVAGLQAAYKLIKDNKTGDTRGYTVEIAVPLASLGLTDVAGKTIGFDASVGIPNVAGDQRERAAHWAGLSESRVVDRPGSAELLPRTWGTMTFSR